MPGLFSLAPFTIGERITSLKFPTDRRGDAQHWCRQPATDMADGSFDWKPSLQRSASDRFSTFEGSVPNKKLCQEFIDRNRLAIEGSIEPIQSPTGVVHPCHVFTGFNQFVVTRYPETVPKVGLEPTRPLGTMDFESIASAIPPLRLWGGR